MIRYMCTGDFLLSSAVFLGCSDEENDAPCGGFYPPAECVGNRCVPRRMVADGAMIQDAQLNAPPLIEIQDMEPLTLDASPDLAADAQWAGLESTVQASFPLRARPDRFFSGASCSIYDGSRIPRVTLASS